MQIGTLKLDCPAVMGILNVTPDSFSDGGQFAARDDALREADAMIAEGAAILDIGGESTRPGAADVSVEEELDRVIPVVEALRKITDAPISVDTSKVAVMCAAANAGADMINDVRALREDGALAAVAELDVAVCLMHMQGQPRTMQREPSYHDVIAEVSEFLAERRDRCVDAGIDQQQIVLDPGFGFGKSHAHNVELLANLRQLADIGQPLLVGLSRKATLGQLTGREIDQRLAASIAAAIVAVMNGAMIVRTHDVAETLDALRVAQAVTAVGIMK
ncbi:MAG: dihydropteroate synthase [Gammaproteobacteria bacterium]|nr:dihydropteroate synthase [Gammaproteobacteria bacterium]